MATRNQHKAVLTTVEPILKVSKRLASEAETQRAAQRRKRRPPVSEWENHDPLSTERTKMMSWHLTKTGVLGLAQYIVNIAQYEADNEARKSANDSSDLSSQQRQGTASERTRAASIVSVKESSDSLGDIIVDTPGGRDQNDGTADASKSTEYDKSWDLILDDSKHNGCRKIIYYLSSIPIELLQALIGGNVPSQMEDIRFRRKVEPYVTPVDRQGTYGIWVAMTRVPAQSTQQDSDLNRNVGRGLTMRQLEKVHDTMHKYIDFTDPESAKLAEAIDGSFSGGEKRRSSWDYLCQRRYASGAKNHEFGHHLQWLNFIELHYLKWARTKVGTNEEHFLDIPMQRCFVYVGLSNSVVGRLTSHWKHSEKINRVLGLLTATLEYLYPSTFSVTKSSYQIFKTVSKKDIGFDEKLSMILTSAYPWDGGLNAAYGGHSRGAGPTDLSNTALRKLQSSEHEIRASGLVKLNLDDSLCKMAEYEANVTAATRKRALRDRVLREVHENAQNTKSLVQEVETLKASHKLALNSTSTSN